MEDNNDTIGVNAGMIWHLLQEKGALSIREMGELTSLNSWTLGLAVGWLARENKVHFSYENATLHMSISKHPSDLYY